MNVRDDRSLSNGGVAHQLVELIVTSDGKVDVLRLDGFVPSVLDIGTSEFQNFRDNVLEDSSHVNTCCGG